MSLRMTCAISFYYGNSHTLRKKARHHHSVNAKKRDAFIQRHFYTQNLLHINTFTHRRFHTETFFMHTHTDAFPHRDFYTKTL